MNESTKEDGKACYRVDFIGRTLIASFSIYIGRCAEVQELLEHFLKVSVVAETQERTWIWSGNKLFLS